MDCCDSDVVIYCYLVLEKAFFLLILGLNELGCLAIFKLRVLSVCFNLRLGSRILLLLDALLLLRCLLLTALLFKCCLSEWNVVWFYLHFYLQRYFNVWVFTRIHLFDCVYFWLFVWQVLTFRFVVLFLLFVTFTESWRLK